MIPIFFLLLFIHNSNAESAIHLQKNKTIESAGAPKSVVISPDGKYAAVTNLEGGNILIIDARTKKIVKKIQFVKTPGTGYDYQINKTIPSFQEKPVEAVFSPGGRYLFISLHNAGGIVIYDMKEELRSSVSMKKVVVKNLVSGTEHTYEIPFIKTGVTPKVLLFSPDFKYLYVSNWHSGNVSAIETKSMKKMYDIGKMKMPRGMSYLPGNRYLAVANAGADFISVLDTQKRNTAFTIPSGKNPRHIISGRNNGIIFVSLMADGYVAKINLLERKVKSMVKVGSSPRTIVLSSNGRYLFSANYDDDTISVVDTRTMKETGRYKTEMRPCGLCISPDDKELWVTNYISSVITVFKITGTNSTLPFF